MLCYALLLFGSICHLAPFEKPTDCTNLKSFPKSPRKLPITLMYSLTDVSLFYHYNNQWAPVSHLYITQAMRYVRHNETPNGFSKVVLTFSWAIILACNWIVHMISIPVAVYTTRMPLCIYSLLYITLPTAECVYAYMYHTRTFMEHHVTCIDLGAKLVFFWRLWHGSVNQSPQKWLFRRKACESVIWNSGTHWRYWSGPRMPTVHDFLFIPTWTARVISEKNSLDDFWKPRHDMLPWPLYLGTQLIHLFRSHFVWKKFIKPDVLINAQKMAIPPCEGIIDELSSVENTHTHHKVLLRQSRILVSWLILIPIWLAVRCPPLF